MSLLLFHLAIALSLLRFTDSDYPFGIFKRFFPFQHFSNPRARLVNKVIYQVKSLSVASVKSDKVSIYVYFTLLWSSLSNISIKLWLRIYDSLASKLCSLCVMSPQWEIRVFAWTFIYRLWSTGRLIRRTNQNHVFPKSFLYLIHEQSKRNYPRISHNHIYPPWQTKHNGLVQNVYHNHFIEWYLFLPWYSWKFAQLTLNSYHSLIHSYTFLYNGLNCLPHGK